MRLASSSIAAFAISTAACLLSVQAQGLSPFCSPDFFGCLAEYEPVCGSNGKDSTTFSSPCDLEVAKCKSPLLKEDYHCECNAHGKCPCDDFVACLANYDPVCFRLSNGESTQFPNYCEFRRAACGNALVASAEQCVCNKHGKCDAPPEPKPPATKCAVPKFKICATNDKTYEDAKAFLAGRLMNPTIKFKSIGKCGAPPLAIPLIPEADTGDQCGIICTAPNLYKPVCTPKGAIFQNKCFHLQALCCDGESYPDARAEFCNPLLLP